MTGSPTFSEAPEGTLLPGTRLGKYQINRLLGAGGMGAVYEATHTEIGKQVAVKVLSQMIASVPGAQGRFLREAQLTSRVRHPNIVDVTDMGSEGGQTFLVMELLRGEDLAHRLSREGHLPPQDVADILLPVCSAIVAAHKAGVTHRDLKPSNIFLSDSQHATEPKILDFGISKSMDSGVGPDALTGTGAVVGTPFYLAPEQVMNNRSAGPATDQYALGVILYECLTGQRPFQGESLYSVFNDIVTGTPLPPRAHRPEIPPSLEQVVQRAMNVNPRERYESTADLGRALLPFASNRVRSIWQEAFEFEERGAVKLADGTTGDLRPGRAVAVTRVMTPSANAGPGGPVGLAGGTQIAMSATPSPTGSPRSRGQRVAFAESEVFPESDVPPNTFDLRPKSRLPLYLGIAAALALGGMATWYVLEQPGTGSDRTGMSKKQRRSPARAQAAGVQDDQVAEDRPKEPARPPEVFQLSVSVEPENALIELDGRPVGRGRLERSLPLDRQPHRMRLVAEGYEPEIVEFTDTPPPKRITLTTVPTRAVERPEIPPVGAEPRRRHRRNSDHGAKRTGQETDRPQSPTLNPNGAPIID